MASDPVGTISGISSGIQWRDMVAQIISIESSRTVTPLTARQTKLTSAAAAWTEFQTVAGRFRDAAKAVRDATGFTSFSTTASKSPTTSRDLVSVTADKTAAPGDYSLEVVQLAAAEKLSGNVAATATTALGIAGSFAINGSTVTVTASDTITTLKDKINALNAGSTPTGVSASILRSGTGARLVLSADQTGQNGIEFTDDASGTAQSLGFTDSTVAANITADGLTQSNRLSSSTAAIASLLGVPLPAPSVVTVGGQQIAVDFTVDSLATIAAKINAASGVADAASVVTETVGGRIYSRLQTSLAVEVDNSDAVNSARTLAVLGLTKSGRGGIAQVVKSANTFTDAGNASANAGYTAKLTDLQVAGQSLGISAGDSITITGKRGDGSVVLRTVSVGAATTMQDLIDSANNATSGFAAGSRGATLDVSGGQFVLTDGTAGDSQLGMSIKVTKAGGGTISLGSFGTADGTVGRSRQITAGADAVFKVDDQAVVRSSNTVSDVVSGVTLNLLAAEEGTAVSVRVTRDTAAAVSGMRSFVNAYNDLRSWADNNLATGKRLEGNTALKSMVSTLSSQFLQTVTGVTGTYTTASMAGLSRDKTGVLALDETVFKSAMASNFDAVRQLFGQVGTPSDSEITFDGATDKTKATATPYAVVITQAATQGSATGSALATYATSGTPDTMNITDRASGVSGSVTLTNGDSLDKIVANLNSMFATKSMRLLASNNSGALKISATDYGSGLGFTVGYTAGSADGTAQIGIAAGSYAGLDVAGTIGGVAGTGAGRVLTGAIGSSTEGMRLSYLGTTARAAGTIAFSVGVGGMLYNAAAEQTRDLNGQAAILSTTATGQADALAKRIQDAQDRLATRRATLTKQFIQMESAMNSASSLGASLTSQINGLFNYNKTA